MTPLQFKQILNLDQLFPLERFSRFKQINGYDLHFAIIHEVTAKYLNLIHELPLETLEKKEQKHRYTPLHLCVMMQNVDLIKFLANKITQMNPCDIDGWTPLHYAHLVKNPDIIQLLESLYIQREQPPLKIAKLSCGQIKNMLNREPAADDQPVFNYQDPLTNTIIYNAPAKKFKELTGATFTPHTLITAEYILHLKNKSQPDDCRGDALKAYVIKNYQTYLSSPPQLYLAQNASGWGVFSNEEISAGQLVAHYAGKTTWISTPTKQTFLVTGENYRNFGHMINDGLPNVMAVRVTIDNVPDSFVYLALRPIKKGEQLLLDYKFVHSIKSKGPYINQAENELEEILSKEKGVLEIHDKLNKLMEIKHQNLMDFLAFERLRSAFGYLFNTPAVLLDFMLKDKIYITQIQHLPLRSLDRILGIGAHIPLAKVFHQILSEEHLDMMEQFENLNDTDQELYHQALEFLLCLGKKYNVLRRLYLHRYLSRFNLADKKTWSKKNQRAYIKRLDLLNDGELQEMMNKEYSEKNKTTTYFFQNSFV